MGMESSQDHTEGMNEQHTHQRITITPGMLYYGNTIILLSTLNPDGSTNIAPMSSSWALGDTIVLGMALDSQTAHNLKERKEAVLNLPGPELWSSVERLGDLTDAPQGRRQHGHGSIPYADKFAEIGLTRASSQQVRCAGIDECRLQIEAVAERCVADIHHEFLIAQLHVLEVHADPNIVVPGTQHIDPTAWRPLVYNFRHYFTLGPQLGESSISQTPTRHES